MPLSSAEQAVGRHPLDRPIWSALSSRQASFARGDDRARRFDPDVAPFAASADDSPQALDALGKLIADGATVILLQAGETRLPSGTIAESSAPAVQMVLQSFNPATGSAPIEPLDPSAAAEMRALAELTRPGPFAARTHELGEFFGIRDRGRLVAMAGERMKTPGYCEVSAVCTHPDSRGRGFAAKLTSLVVSRILARGETPMLHAYASNKGAIALYERLGFLTRSEMTVIFLKRASGSTTRRGGSE